jgi:integrase
MTQEGFGDFTKQWFETHVRTNNKEREQDNKEMILRLHLVPFFGGMKLGDITTAHVERLKGNLLSKGLAGKTVNNCLAVLNKCLHDACDWDLIQKTPRIRLLKVSPQSMDYLTEVEMTRLLSDNVEPQWRLMALCALRTGMRVGELCALNWTNVDFERQQIAVCHSVSKGRLCSPKSNKTRYIPMADDLYAALSQARRKTGTVFPPTEGGYLTHSMTRKALVRMCKRTGLRIIGWHALRHSFASCLVSRGISLYVVQQLLGHSNVTTTMRYSHLAPSTMRDAVRFFPNEEMIEVQKYGQPVGNRPENERLPEVPLGYEMKRIPA